MKFFNFKFLNNRKMKSVINNKFLYKNWNWPFIFLKIILFDAKYINLG